MTHSTILSSSHEGLKQTASHLGRYARTIIRNANKCISIVVIQRNHHLAAAQRSTVSGGLTAIKNQIEDRTGEPLAIDTTAHIRLNLAKNRNRGRIGMRSSHLNCLLDDTSQRLTTGTKHTSHLREEEKRFQLVCDAVHRKPYLCEEI